MAMTDVRDKWALITGASRGIGYLTAKFLAEKECNLILHGRTLEATAGVLKEVTALGVDAYCVAADFEDLSQVEKMLAEIDAKGTHVDIVVNNAAFQSPYRHEYLKTPSSDFSLSFTVNTIAPAMICYHFLPKMLVEGFGRIANTTSGITLDPQQAGYSASKAALDKITIDIGSKVEGSDIMINLADPGWCRTDLGGPNAPNSPESSLPGIVVGIFVNDKKSGRYFGAQDFAGKTLEEAVAYAQAEYESPYPEQE
ncbi:MAG: SDR family oxidoreductase [Oscillospiraceae bacterium]|nr:SDR family oxidoreductase [Oscillospiraceae bacterium]